MNKELMEALNILEKEKDISKDTMLEAIENSLLTACKNHFGKADNVKVVIDRNTCDFEVYAEKEVTENVEDDLLQISLEKARDIDAHANLGDTVHVEIKSKEFGRIATQNAKNVILQKIREEERKVLFNQFYGKEKEVVTGIVQRYVGKNVSINLGKCDAMLNENEQVKGEVFRPTERIKVYILEVKDTTKGPRILVSRVNAIVEELRGEKIDIINWDENPALLIENALSPAKVICVVADEDEKTAQVIVPDYQLSLAIGKVGQNARLAARLTGYKIDIKSETQARESGLFEEIGYNEDMDEEYAGYEEYETYEEYPEGETEYSDEDEYDEEGYDEQDENGADRDEETEE